MDAVVFDKTFIFIIVYKQYLEGASPPARFAHHPLFLLENLIVYGNIISNEGDTFSRERHISQGRYGGVEPCLNNQVSDDGISNGDSFGGIPSSMGYSPQSKSVEFEIAHSAVFGKI